MPPRDVSLALSCPPSPCLQQPRRVTSLLCRRHAALHQDGADAPCRSATDKLSGGDQGVDESCSAKVKPCWLVLHITSMVHHHLHRLHCSGPRLPNTKILHHVKSYTLDLLGLLTNPAEQCPAEELVTVPQKNLVLIGQDRFRPPWSGLLDHTCYMLLTCDPR